MPEVRLRMERQGEMTEKPPYRVPSMEEVRALPPNGPTVASTFSGCGGSSLGYRMAGFRVLWANEFVDAARDSYRANAAPYTVVDGRDIRKVDPAEVLEACKLKVGELDLFDGSPPCASFSTAGKREKHWGKAKAYSDKVQRTDDLFFEYARMVRGIRPRVFVAENVSGLVKGTAKGYFLEILKELKSCGYRVEAKLLDAQWLGVPQARQRLIFVGVREDLGRAPAFPKPLPYRYSVRDALPWVVATGGIRKTGFGAKRMSSANEPCATIMAGGGGGMNTSQFGVQVEKESWMDPTITQRGGDASVASVAHPTERRKFSIAELRRICGFPDDFVLTGTYAQQWERLGRAVPPVMMAAVARAIREKVLEPCAG